MKGTGTARAFRNRKDQITVCEKCASIISHGRRMCDGCKEIQAKIVQERIEARRQLPFYLKPDPPRYRTSNR